LFYSTVFFHFTEQINDDDDDDDDDEILPKINAFKRYYVRKQELVYFLTAT